MSDTQAPSQAAALFQKAHGRIVLLQRVEAQIAALQTQKRRILAELTEAQTEINDEFVRLMGHGEELPDAEFADVSPEPVRRGTGNGNGHNELTVPSIPDEPVGARVSSLGETLG